MPADPDIEAVKAEGRRLLAEYRKFEAGSGVDVTNELGTLFWNHADLLLAPAPKLTEEERRFVERERRFSSQDRDATVMGARLIAIIDRLSSPDTTEAPE